MSILANGDELGFLLVLVRCWSCSLLRCSLQNWHIQRIEENTLGTPYHNHLHISKADLLAHSGQCTTLVLSSPPGLHTLLKSTWQATGPGVSHLLSKQDSLLSRFFASGGCQSLQGTSVYSTRHKGLELIKTSQMAHRKRPQAASRAITSPLPHRRRYFPPTYPV